MQIRERTILCILKPSPGFQKTKKCCKARPPVLTLCHLRAWRRHVKISSLSPWLAHTVHSRLAAKTNKKNFFVTHKIMTRWKSIGICATALLEWLKMNDDQLDLGICLKNCFRQMPKRAGRQVVFNHFKSTVATTILFHRVIILWFMKSDGSKYFFYWLLLQAVNRQLKEKVGGVFVKMDR